ncbi:3D domain-containing protein [Lentibacillus cibarius]|uniref:LysM peptidoglycan-binding domain-containing protein n=1 Tax=Lentibacillus cibarius TaxID=2583219 RepID=A0A5S3QK22_9BACI|nr:3D domain-containing protein [Lentibacillus cibarius]TMN22077.1 LysM peptidoglycan-binding domain-containing protein [Lentibacillus cibarius]
MKKLAVSIVAAVSIAGVALTSVTAEEQSVEKGDNLWTIAETNHTTEEKQVDINEFKTTTIQPKQKLNLHQTYEVQRGDTLISIGKAYHVSVDNLKKWNELESNLIVIGQELDMKGVQIEQKKAAVASSHVANETTADQREKQAKQTSDSKQQPSKDNPEGKTVTVSATAYTADCDGCSGVTSTGVDLNANPNAKVIAVDPNVIPLGSEVYVEGYGYATAADIGSAIQGKRIDIHVPTKKKAYNWGVRTVDVTIVNK